MPHREKVAWLYLIAMAVTYGPYFTLMAVSPPSAPLPDLHTMALFAATTVAQMIILAAGHLWLRVKAPDDARAPADERDRAIDRRSLRLAYFVLMAGAIGVGCIMPFCAAGWQLVNAAVLMIVAAETVHHGVVITSYRRGWHE